MDWIYLKKNRKELINFEIFNSNQIPIHELLISGITLEVSECEREEYSYHQPGIRIRRVFVYKV